MAFNSPIYSRIMAESQADGKSALASTEHLRNIQQPQELSQVSTASQVPLSSAPQVSTGDMYTPVDPHPDQSSDFMTKLYDVETKGGTMKDRPGSQYKGIAQLGDAIRKPLLKEMGYTEAQYDSDKNIQKLVATKHIDNIRKQLGSKATDLDIWLSHNQGAGGRRQILSGKPGKQVLKNLRNQKGMNSGSTPQDYLRYYGNIFR